VHLVAIVFTILGTIGVSTSAQDRGGKPARLNSQIPAAQSAKYRLVTDAKDWRNPYLVIVVDGVEIISESVPSGRQVVHVEKLRATLIELPVRAWPYGRVVAAQDNGLRDADGSHDEPIRRNHQAAMKILDGLRIKIEWWPSA
jgi:hypothetical protein